jgi:hypothetical protein
MAVMKWDTYLPRTHWYNPTEQLFLSHSAWCTTVSGSAMHWPSRGCRALSRVHGAGGLDRV